MKNCRHLIFRTKRIRIGTWFSHFLLLSSSSFPSRQSKVTHHYIKLVFHVLFGSLINVIGAFTVIYILHVTNICWMIRFLKYRGHQFREKNRKKPTQFWENRRKKCSKLLITHQLWRFIFDLLFLTPIDFKKEEKSFQR